MNGSWINPLRDSDDRRLPRIAGPSVLVLFGVTGDLARKKLLPAIYELASHGRCRPAGLVGFARRDWTNEQFIQHGGKPGVCPDALPSRGLATAVQRHRVRTGQLRRAGGVRPSPADPATIRREHGTGGNHAFYRRSRPRTSSRSRQLTPTA